jgi:hypothetical protein
MNQEMLTKNQGNTHRENRGNTHGKNREIRIRKNPGGILIEKTRGIRIGKNPGEYTREKNQGNTHVRAYLRDALGNDEMK